MLLTLAGPNCHLCFMHVSARPITKLSLQNNGTLDLVCLGVGSAFSKALNQTNLFLVKGDTHLLIDCGTLCSHTLYHHYQTRITDIDNFLITHSHADHIGGLEEVQLSNRYVTHRKPNIIITKAYEKILWDQSLRGGAEASEGTPLNLKDFWHIIRPKKLKHYGRDVYETNLGAMNLKLFRTKHFPDTTASWRTSAWSCGVLIDERIMFTSDTRFDPPLLNEFEAKFSPELIFHDCQLFTGGVHTGIEELATLPAEMKRKIVLIHYGDQWKTFRKFAEEAGFHSWAKQGYRYRFN